MPLAVSCPACHNPLTVHETQFGRLLTCPACRHPLVVTAPVRVPAELDPFTLDDVPTRRRPRPRADGAHTLLVAGGYLCALFSLVIFPPALGLSGAVLGGFCLARGSTANGMLIVVLSLVCATVGMIWGAEVAITGRPRFLID